MINKKPVTKKQKKLVEEAARRFAEILISHLEWKKGQQIDTNKNTIQQNKRD